MGQGFGSGAPVASREGPILTKSQVSRCALVFAVLLWRAAAGRRRPGPPLPLAFAGGVGRNCSTSRVQQPAPPTQRRGGRCSSPWRLLSFTLLTRRTAFWSTPIWSLLVPNTFFMYFSAKQRTKQ